MTLADIWRRFMARRHRRRSFYGTQDVMRRAIAEEAARRKQSPDPSASGAARNEDRTLRH